MTPVEAGILMTIADAPGLTSSAVAARMGVDASTLSQALNPMERRGLLRRAPSPSDRRTRCLWLTDEGQRMLEQVRELVALRRNQPAGGLTEAETSQLHQLLARIIAHEEAGRS